MDGSRPARREFVAWLLVAALGGALTALVLRSGAATSTGENANPAAAAQSAELTRAEPTGSGFRQSRVVLRGSSGQTTATLSASPANQPTTSPAASQDSQVEVVNPTAGTTSESLAARQSNPEPAGVAVLQQLVRFE